MFFALLYPMFAKKTKKKVGSSKLPRSRGVSKHRPSVSHPDDGLH